MVDETENIDDFPFETETKESDEGLMEENMDVLEDSPENLLDKALSEDISEPENIESEQSVSEEMPEDVLEQENVEEDTQEAFSYPEETAANEETDEAPNRADGYPVSSENSAQNIGNLRWYSGTSEDKIFTLSKGFESGEFVADEECQTIHVNVGYDTYGWEVQFSNGVVMNLRDVREYQIRNGKLPSENGRIIFGNSELSFSAVQRIVVYETVKYFSYGI